MLWTIGKRISYLFGNLQKESAIEGVLKQDNPTVDWLSQYSYQDQPSGRLFKEKNKRRYNTAIQKPSAEEDDISIQTMPTAPHQNTDIERQTFARRRLTSGGTNLNISMSSEGLPLSAKDANSSSAKTKDWSMKSKSRVSRTLFIGNRKTKK
eukprot:TRINITY_DN4820_c0_g1_i1.p1 TRINITY_DN4820_c0_g1~~TRINITY_DN4820_c0_g1_i1.p1  ORF type:complete len:152 (-),score=17.32 TRINITY_DN4820_c0_g1_i1:177-632(-)